MKRFWKWATTPLFSPLIFALTVLTSSTVNALWPSDWTATAILTGVPVAVWLPQIVQRIKS